VGASQKEEAVEATHFGRRLASPEYDWHAGLVASGADQHDRV